MKIVSVHIENFGKLSKTDIDFTEGLNVKCEENGWGKSTLSTFIRAMFYGFEGDGKRDEINSERKRFSPWQGGAYGGSLALEAHGKVYRITRFFGIRALDDSFELRDERTNLVSEDYSENIGEELFHINSESFMNTVFIRQSDAASSKATDDINAKLGNISDGLDLNNFALADSIIKDVLNNSSATRKTGDIARAKAEASVLRSSIQKGVGLEETMQGVSERIEATKELISAKKAELSALTERKNKAVKFEKQLSLKKAYEELLREFREKDALLKAKRELFPGEIPSKKLAGDWETACDRMNQAKAVVAGTQMSEAEETLYKSLLETFCEGIPSEESFRQEGEKASRLFSLKNDALSHNLSSEDELRLSHFSEIFQDVEAEENGLAEASEDWNERTRQLSEYKLLEREYSDKDFSLSEKKPGGALIFVGIILMLLGIGFSYLSKGVLVFFDKQMIAGLIGAFLGLVLLILGVVKKGARGREIGVLAADVSNIKGKMAEITDFCDDVYEAVHNLLLDHNADCEDAYVSRALSRLSMELHDYRVLLKRKEDSLKFSNSQEIDSLRVSLDGFLNSYGMYASEGEYLSKIADLKGKAGHFKSLESKSREHKNAKASYNSLKEELTEQLLHYSIEPGMDVSSTVDDVLNNLTEYESVLNIYNDVALRLDRFKQENDIDVIENISVNPEDKSLDELIELESELNEEMENLRANLATDTRSLDDFNETYENWLEEKEELQRLEDEIKEKTIRLHYVKKAGEYLTMAKENLTARYMEPLLTGFSKYYSALTGEPASRFRIDANTNITIEEQGKQRSTQSLSYGYQDLIGFCMRLAMADAMYTGEKPTLIMDDPFVNLDDKKIVGARELLKEVSKDYQIIYLTCRENRI